VTRFSFTCCSLLTGSSLQGSSTTILIDRPIAIGGVAIFQRSASIQVVADVSNTLPVVVATFAQGVLGSPIVSAVDTSGQALCVQSQISSTTLSITICGVYSRLSAGAIAGITIAAVAFAIVAGFAVLLISKAVIAANTATAKAELMRKETDGVAYARMN
jgi:hypothetical protein